MAFDKYKDGAWQEPEDTVRRYADGAWTECESAKRYIDGAWGEIWANSQPLFLRVHTTTTGCLFSNDKWDDDIWLWATDDSGYIDIWTEQGSFVDAPITYCYDGSRYNPTYNRYLSSGTLSIIGEDSSGSVVTVSSGHTVNTGDSGEEDVEVSVIASGTYKRLGFRMKFSNWQIGDGQQSTVFLSHITIAGKKYILDESANFSYL